MAVVRGVGSIWGAILGAGLVSILKDVLQDILPKFISVGGNVEIIVFGAILILILQVAPTGLWPLLTRRSEEHTSELQSLMRISYAVFCLKKKNRNTLHNTK